MPDTAAKNRILSMEIAFPQESWLLDRTFHTHLMKEIMENSFPKPQMSLITLQEVSSLVMNLFQYAVFQSKCLHSCHLLLKLNFFTT